MHVRTMENRPKKVDEDLRSKLSEMSIHFKTLLQETHNKALLQNEAHTKRWEDYKKDHLEVSERLMALRDKLSHDIMVPIGKRALMKGRLVHTNEIMVCLGDGWFAKQSAKQASDICCRRIEHCDEMLKKLKKEEELLNSRKSFPFENQAFCNDDQTEEIIEPYDEEEERLWREKHRLKEKEYRKKLAELKKAPKPKIETEEDLWSRLDVLDLQEELEDELNRMDNNLDEEEEDSEDDSDSDDETCEEEPLKNEEKNVQRRVSFKEEKYFSESEPKSDCIDENTIRIVFKHSDVPMTRPLTSSNEILTPSDIYLNYSKQKMPKSILKTSSVNSQDNVETEKSHPIVPPSNVIVNLPSIPAEPSVKAVSEEVVERVPAIPAVAAVERPMSRFKAARMATKR